MLRPIFLFAMFVWLFALEGVGETLVVRLPGRESADDPRLAYFDELLDLALGKTEPSDGPYRIEKSRLAMLTHGRGSEFLKRGGRIDVIYTMTSIEREREFLPVRIPLLKGLLGHRIFIIRKQDEARFAAIGKLEELRKFKAGQGHRWPDVEILEANGIAVEVGRSYGGLFEMLERGRFDFFPRGVTEAHGEAALHADQGLVVEQTLMLVYPTAMYFFVNRENTSLAGRIERGLRQALADGSFDRVFDKHNASLLERARMHTRRVFHLQNPILPAETPLGEANLWYHVPD